MTFPEEMTDMRPILVRLPIETIDNVLSVVYRVEEGVSRELFLLSSIPISMKFILKEVEETKLFTMSVSSVYSKYNSTYKIDSPRGSLWRGQLPSEACYYVDSDIYYRSYYVDTNIMEGFSADVEICILDTMIAVRDTRSDNRIHYPSALLRTDNQSIYPDRGQLPELLNQRVVRTDPFEDESELICKAEIKPDAFRNLLNKCGKPENRLSLILDDNKIGVVKDGEAYDVVSYYKANNVEVPQTTEQVYCDTEYGELYSLLYRRKAGDQGIFERLDRLGQVPETIWFGINRNGKLCIEIPDGRGRYIIECPQTDSLLIPTYSEIKTKAYRNSSTRVSTKKDYTESQSGEVSVKYDISSDYLEIIPSEEVENGAYVLTDEDEVRMSAWREVHIQNGGTSEDPKRWFADYTLNFLQNGISIPQEDLDLVSKL